MGLESNIRDMAALFSTVYCGISCLRYVAALEGALRALALRLLLHMVLHDQNVVKRCTEDSDILDGGSLNRGVLGSASEISERVGLLREYADDLLVREQCEAWMDFEHENLECYCNTYCSWSISGDITIVPSWSISGDIIRYLHRVSPEILPGTFMEHLRR